MQVKIFEADDMRSALEQVKQSLGSGALIISTRNILKKNRFGLPGKSVIEVTAAIDNDMESPPGRVTGHNHREPPAKESPPVTGKITSQPAKSGKINGYAGCDSFEEILSKRAPKIPEEKINGRDTDLADEIRRMRQSFADLSREFSQARGDWSKQLLSVSAGIHNAGADGGQGDLLARLHGCGLDTVVAKRFFETMTGEINAPTLDDPDDSGDPDDTDGTLSLLEAFIAKNLNTNYPFDGALNGPKRIAFIGPTGVGKTTTIAKLAAHYMLTRGKNIALVTIDNYRIAAAEQLKIYGGIMNIPVEVARTPEQLARTLARHRDKDLVLVDTAGRNPKDELGRQELASFLDPALEIENHLVLSATTRESELFSAIRHFEQLNLHGIVFTKTDECDLLGQILNIGMQAGHPLSMLTNGQRVPEDFLPPEPRALAKMILTKNKVVEQWNMEKSGTRREHSVH